MERPTEGWQVETSYGEYYYNNGDAYRGIVQ